MPNVQLKAAADIARQQVDVLEEHYDSQLSQLTKLCADLCKGSADLDLLRAQNAELVSLFKSKIEADECL